MVTFSPSQKGHKELPGVYSPVRMDPSNPIFPWEADDKATLEASSYMGLRFNVRGVRFCLKGPDVWIGRSGGDWVWVYFEIDYLRMFTSRKLT